MDAVTRIIVTIASLSLALCAFFPHRPVFLPFVTAGCQPSLLHEQEFALQYDKTRFIVDLNPCSDQLQTRHFETSDEYPEGRFTEWSFVAMDFTVRRLETWGAGHWREVQYVEFRDFRFPFTVHAYRSE